VVRPAVLIALGLATACRPGDGATAPGPAATETEPPATEMIAIPAGSFTMGRDRSRHGDEGPAHRVELSAFWLDATLVTVADFRRYVDETGVRTSAERVGFGMAAIEGMDDWAWKKIPGASWRAPWGDEDVPPQRDDEPVVMVSWFDAANYCAHHGKRLPTEAQWEYAMRAGTTTRYPWGDEPRTESGAYGLNFWQGRDHHHNDREDGYVYLSPVRAFPPNAWGLYDPVGNVWQWVADWYDRDTYRRDADGVRDPQGPDTGWARVARGGSWWCSAHTCAGYGLFARGKSRPHAPFANNGFRCAADGPDGPGRTMER
jgi:formylglycine-generating enzyme